MGLVILLYVVSNDTPSVFNSSDVDVVYVIGKSKHLDKWLSEFKRVVYVKNDQNLMELVRAENTESRTLILDTSWRFPEISLNSAITHNVIYKDTSTRITNLADVSGIQESIVHTTIDIIAGEDDKTQLKNLLKYECVSKSYIHIRIGDVYFYKNKYKKAIYHYTQAYNMRKNNDEIFYSLYRVGVCSLKLNKDNAVNLLLTAWELDTRRMEPLYELTKYYREKGELNVALFFGLRAMVIPTVDAFRVNRACWLYLIHYELANICYKCDEIELGKKCYNIVLQNAPSYYVDRIKCLSGFYV